MTLIRDVPATGREEIPDRRNLVMFPIGWLMVVIALAEMVLVLVSFALLDGEAQAFLVAALGTFMIGTAIIITFTPKSYAMDFRQAVLFVTTAWIVIPAVAAIPLMMPPVSLSFADAYFETVSAITTTGSTVMRDLDGLPQTILLWRSTMQWVGGIGIIGMALVIFPFLRLGGMQLFKLESSDRSEKLFYRSGQLAGAIFGVYLLITVGCILVYRVGGMNWFDALNHALTTVCTGGFSTHDASMGYFKSSFIDWASIVFMAASGIPFLTYVRLTRPTRASARMEKQVVGFLIFITAVSIAIAVWLSTVNNMPFAPALTQSTFSVVSIVTTTGYATQDYLAWGTPVAGMFFLLTFVGGCTGSTAGGIKIFRFQVLARMIAQLTMRQTYPHAIVVPHYGNRILSDDEVASVCVFVFLYIVTWLGVSLLLQLVGLDPMTALSGSITALSNVGPGIGAIIGPAGNFASLPDAAKWLLSAAMILGRLEIMTCFVLLVPAFYR